MKNIIKNSLATTGLALMIFSIVAVLYNGKLICIETVFQILLSSLVINFILILLKHFESKFFLVEVFTEIGSTLAVLIVAGYWFNWYVSTPIWVLIIMGIVVYLIGCLIDMFHITNDIKFINDQIMKRKNAGE